MDLTVVRDKLIKNSCNEEAINSIMSTIRANINSFTFANEPLELLELYIVLRNTGDYKLFKTLGGNIVLDKLDLSFTESRDLVGVSSWNIKGVCRVYFKESKEVGIEKVPAKDFRKVLFSVVEPSTSKYVIGIDKETSPIIINVDVEMYNTLKYKDLKDCVVSAYNRKLELNGIEKVLETPTCYLVGYASEELIEVED